jgi:formamidopyrimidine-DNA glycosylase
MPELPEVETVRRGLARHLEGRRVTKVEARRRDLRVPLPDRFAARLAGRRIERFTRRAKYLRAHLDDGWVWIIHLGMSGRMMVHEVPPGPPGPHDHVRIAFEGGLSATYTDHRRFGLMALAKEDALDRHPLFAALGPEPLGADFDGPTLAARLKAKRTPIKAALLDQSVVAGIGNIYACEALFEAGLSPRRLAYTVQGGRAERLAMAIRAVLERAIAAGGSSLRDYAQTTGELGNFQHSFAVYDRVGEPCPGCDCRAGVRRIVQSNRSTFYCAKRQH